MASTNREFDNREVGLSHPDLPSFIRLTNDGEIEIVASEGLSIIMNPRDNSINFIADSIKFFTREGSGALRWNNLDFNDQATVYTEPTLTKHAVTDRGQNRGVNYFLDDGEELDNG